MFVKTQFDTIVNVTNYDMIKIEFDVKDEYSGNVYHIISVVSESRPNPSAAFVTVKEQTIAQFKGEDEKLAEKAYRKLYHNLQEGKPAFDMTSFLGNTLDVEE